MSVYLTGFIQSFLASFRSSGRIPSSRNWIMLSTKSSLAYTCTTSPAGMIDDSGTRQTCSYEESNSSSEAAAK
jgi:hypothetical protein